MAEQKSDVALTPLMKQYNSIKSKYPDALLLFRVGDFYETFGEDAIKASAILGIVLTRRANGSAAYVELAGFPHHSIDTYLPKLVRAGHRVAICDQLEDPKLTKTIVKRGVTELVTPGVTYNDKILEHKENNFLAGIFLNEKNSGAAFLDISTGEFMVAEGDYDYLDKLLHTFKPSEVVVQKNKRQQFISQFGEQFYISYFEDWVYVLDFAADLLTKQFGTASLKGFGIDHIPNGIIAAGAVLYYLSETQHDKIRHINKLSRIEEDEFVWLDRFTVRNLELLGNSGDGKSTLLSVIDRTITPMGSRLMRRWILLPLKKLHKIIERQNIVSEFFTDRELSVFVAEKLKAIGDLERLISKAAIGRIAPREMIQMYRSLSAIDPLKTAFGSSTCKELILIGNKLNACKYIREKIFQTLAADPASAVGKGKVIADGVNEELDNLRNMAFSGKDYLAQLQQREIENTGISSLKVGFNNVFGYYLEVTNAHKEKVPEEWSRKQTLVNSERYITEELKDYEQKILTAEEKILELENRLYFELINDVAGYTEAIQINAQQLSLIDCLLSLALVAQENKYSRPDLDETLRIQIVNGRHPVIEKHLPAGEQYIANSLELDTENQQIIILTGPNMSGKSALLRQTALIVLMAQMGGYVPSEAAVIGLVDKIYTRVGASDNITSGESTFMVEMNETASILNNLSSRSLLLLDEIGRGTSTYDGISIAWAIAEYIHDHPLYRAKTLFATHYHELNELAESKSRIKNYHIAVRETGKKVLFLRKLTPGGSEHSFGIHVARMAGMPQSLLQRAEDLLAQLEKTHTDPNIQAVSKLKGGQKSNPNELQLSFFQLDDPLLLRIRDDILQIEINTLTPVEALLKLNEIKKLLEKY